MNPVSLPMADDGLKMRKHALRWEILIALAIKGALLTMVYYVCFSPPHQITADAAMLSEHLLSVPAAAR